MGELFDKTSILSIKKDKIKDPQKMSNIMKEYNELIQLVMPYLIADDNSKVLYDHLKRINEKLWDIEDEIRKMEAKKDFSEDFVALARQVYMTNDIRFDYKKLINEHLGSELTEEKDYVKYKDDTGA